MTREEGDLDGVFWGGRVNPYRWQLASGVKTLSWLWCASCFNLSSGGAWGGSLSKGFWHVVLCLVVLIPFVSCSLPLKDVCSPRKVEIIKSALNEACMHLEDKCLVPTICWITHLLFWLMGCWEVFKELSVFNRSVKFSFSTSACSFTMSLVPMYTMIFFTVGCADWRLVLNLKKSRLTTCFREISWIALLNNKSFKDRLVSHTFTAICDSDSTHRKQHTQ